jgi:hypothetical protein
MNPSSIPYSNKTSTTTAAAASLLVTPSTTTNQHLRCFDIVGYNNGADQYIQVHDSAAAAAEGAVPLAVLLAPAGYQFSWSWTAGRLFANGIYVCNSSTDVTKTIGSADCLFDINYRG